MAVRSCRCGATIWIPTGRPDFVRPAGAAVDGSATTPPIPAQNIWSVVETRLPLTTIMRSVRSPAWSFGHRSEEHTSELQSLIRISYAVFCLTTKHNTNTHTY